MLFARLSIARKLLVATLIAAGSALLVLAAIVAAYEWKSGRANLVEEVRTVARMIAQNSAAAVAFRDQADAAAVLQSLDTAPVISAAALYDESGAPFSRYQRDRSVAPEASRLPPETAPSEGTFLQGRRLVLTLPVEQNGVRIGTLFVAAGLERVYDRFLTYGLLIGAGIGLAILFALGLGRFLHRSIWRPIEELVRVTDQVAKSPGAKVRAAKLSHDEIGHLADAFNTMLGRMEEQGAELRDRDERLRSALLAADMGTWKLDLRTGLDTRDAAFNRLLGLPAVESTQPLSDLIGRVHPQDRSRMELTLKRLQQENRPYDLEHRIVRPDGAISWLRSRGRLFLGAEGRPAYLTGAAVDITALKHAEESIRESESRFRTLADQAPVFVWLSDPEQRFLYLNKPWLEFTGLSFEDALGDGWARAVHPEDREELLGRMRTAFERRDSFRLEYRLRRKEGAYRWVLDHGLPFYAGTEFKGYLGSALDITEIKQAQEALMRSNSELEERVAQRTSALAEANRELEAFSYTVSHDLRAPLRNVRSFAELLQLELEGGGAVAEISPYVEKIGRNIAHMDQLIHDLLRFSQIGRAELSFAPASLNVLVEQVIQSLGTETEGRSIRWEVAELGEVTVDVLLLKQVLINLISNALKYTRTREAAVIEIGRQERPGEAVLFVRDNGVGFSMDHAAKLFHVFERLHGKQFEGTGVGLAIVDRIVRRHGGKVWAEAEPDRGACFWFSLPLREPAFPSFPVAEVRG